MQPILLLCPLAHSAPFSCVFSLSQVWADYEEKYEPVVGSVAGFDDAVRNCTSEPSLVCVIVGRRERKGWWVSGWHLG